LTRGVREKVGIEEKTKSYSSRSASTSTKTPRYYFWKSYSKEELLTPLDVSQSIAEVSSESVEARQTLKSLEKDIDAHFAYLASLPDHWPVNGRMTSPFGNRKSPFGGGSIEFHDGIDLAADYGEPVSAAAGWCCGLYRLSWRLWSHCNYFSQPQRVQDILLPFKQELGEAWGAGEQGAENCPGRQYRSEHRSPPAFYSRKGRRFVGSLEYSELGNDAWLIKVSFFLAPLARGVISLVSPEMSGWRFEDCLFCELGGSHRTCGINSGEMRNNNKNSKGENNGFCCS